MLDEAAEMDALSQLVSEHLLEKISIELTFENVTKVSSSHTVENDEDLTFERFTANIHLRSFIQHI